MLFVASPQYKPFFIIGGIGALAVIGVIFGVKQLQSIEGLDFRFARIMAWLDPEAYASGKGFQTLQALYAIGSGGIFGKAPGQSIQILGFLPEQQNDMIFDAVEYQERSEAGESLLMRKGVIVRHLVMPDCVEDSKRVISYLLKTYGGQIFISIMNQYTPLPQCREYPELSRRVTEAEYDAVVDYAIELGIENGFIQEGDVAEESFIPEFDGEGIVRKDVDR